MQAKPDSRLRAKALQASAIVALCLGLAGCGTQMTPTTAGTRTSTTTVSSHLRNPAFRRALASFATCLRHSSVKLPPTNATSNGPVLDTAGIDTQSAHFKASWARCRHEINLARTFHVPKPIRQTASPANSIR